MYANFIFIVSAKPDMLTCELDSASETSLTHSNTQLVDEAI